MTRIVSSFEHRDQIPFSGKPTTKRGRGSRHDEIGQKLVELGELQGLDAATKYRYEDKIYDVIWKKKVPNASPSHVFEVQIGGNLSDALMRLKHAHDLWNSKVFLISTEKDLTKAEHSLSGALHEIQDYAETILVDELEEYYQVKKHIAALELKLK